jgi:hypothetical protein
MAAIFFKTVTAGLLVFINITAQKINFSIVLHG